MAIYADRWRHEDLERSFKKWFWLYPLTLPADQRSGYVTAPLSYWIAENLVKDEIIKNARHPEVPFRKLFNNAPAGNTFDAWTYTDLMGRMQENMVCRSDATGMAASLEIRAPLLDHKLVEFAARLPVNLKLKGWKRTKYLLAKVAMRHLPESLVRRKKQGFSGVTYPKLIRNAQGPWKNRLEDHLFGSGTLARSNLFKTGGIEKIWAGLCRSDPNAQYAVRYFLLVWALVVFEVWYRTVVE